MKKGCSGLFLAILVVITSLACVYLFFYYVPARVSESFGAPIPTLSPIQKIRFQFELFLNRKSLFSPAGDDQTPSVNLDIQAGDSVTSISTRLEEMGLIPNSTLFTHLLIYTGLDTTIQTGRFALSAAKSPVEIAVALSDPSEVQIPFSVLPGWRLEEIAESINAYGLSFSGQEFLNAARDPASVEIVLPNPVADSLEGIIPPGITYIKKQINLHEFLAALLSNSQERINAEMAGAFQSEGLTDFQAISLASIVQREAIQESEMGLIAGVFLNRLRQGMKLESDPTVQYAVGFDPESGSWWKNPLSYDDLKVNSPYNTYLFAGLPPGPISTPSTEALNAVAYPKNTNFLFFQAKCDGSGFHNFTVTYEEHLTNSCK